MVPRGLPGSGPALLAVDMKVGRQHLSSKVTCVPLYPSVMTLTK